MLFTWCDTLIDKVIIQIYRVWETLHITTKGLFIFQMHASMHDAWQMTCLFLILSQLLSQMSSSAKDDPNGYNNHISK